MHHNDKCLKSVIKALRPLQISPSPTEDLRNKLEIVAVKAAVKPAFFGLPSETETLTALKNLSKKIGLISKITRLPPVFVSRAPTVPSAFFNVWAKTNGRKGIWLYRTRYVETSIELCLKGKLNEGYILGYPECCIKWHEEMRVQDAEQHYEKVQQKLNKDPLAFNVIYASTERELYRGLLSNLEMSESFPLEVSEHLAETNKKYPFVDHIACTQCLTGSSQKTKVLNMQLKQLAKSMSPDPIHRDMIKVALDFARRIRENASKSYA